MQHATLFGSHGPPETPKKLMGGGEGAGAGTRERPVVLYTAIGPSATPARLLLAEGMTEEGHEDGLAHLSGAELTPAEAALGPLARETVWYRTTSLQRHARRVRPRFSAEEFLEFVGIAALAKTGCGLSAVADDR